MATTDIALSEYIQIQNLAYEWTLSYDTKDWARLKTCLASSIRLDFRKLNGALHEDLSPDEYVAILSGKHLIGDPRLKTQHLLGLAKMEVLEDGAVHVSYQARVAHQRYKEEDLKDVVNRGHGYGFVQHWYRKVEGVWKLEASESTLEWSEYDLFGTLAPPEGEEA